MDLNQEIRNFAPIDIEKFSQDNGASEKIIDSVKSYNKAIENLRNGSEDIAMIELKKVVSSNPDFYEAINLLGLCYAYTNQKDKAEELFVKVVEGENNVIKAAEYLNYIGRSENTAAKTGNKVKSNKKADKTEKTVNKPVKNRSFADDDIQSEYVLFKKMVAQFKKPLVAVVFNVISIICLIAAIVFFLSAAKNVKKENTGTEPAVSTQQTEAYNKAIKENSSLKKQLEDANAKLKQIQLASDVSQVSALYGQGKYVEAADKLMALPVKELSADLKNKYDSIKGDILQNAASQLTADGNTLYNKKMYSEAVKKLEKVFTLGSTWPFGDKALYILGKSYVEAKDLQKGAETYQKLINEYPNSPYVKYAKSRLSAIQ